MGKQKSLVQGQISAELKTKFDEQLESLNFNVGKTVESLIQLWTHLPRKLQVSLYTESSNEAEFKKVVNSLIGVEIEQPYKKEVSDILDASEVGAKEIRKKRGRGIAKAG